MEHFGITSAETGTKRLHFPQLYNTIALQGSRRFFKSWKAGVFMRKFISGIAVLSACIALSASSVAYTGDNVLTGVKPEGALAQAAKKEGKVSIQPLKDASVETSAMCLWEHNGSTTENCWLFDKNGEQEIVDYINGIEISDEVKDFDTDSLDGSIYGIGIGSSDGWIRFAWCDGYAFLEDGSVYKADIDFSRIKSSYSWQDKDKMPLASFPNMYYIAKKDGKWNQRFLEKSKKLKSNGLKVTAKKFDGTKLVVKLKNKTKKELCYGEGFSLQVKLDGSWYCIPAKDDMCFIDIANIMKAGKDTKKTYDLSAYGGLPSGKYRIVIDGASAAFNV